MFRKRLFLKILALIFLTGAPAQAKELKACLEPWIPYASVDDKGKVTGISIDIIETALKNIGHTVKWAEMSPARCYEEIDKGTIDFTMNVSKNDSRKWIHSKTIIVDWELSPILPANSPIKEIKDLKELYGKKLGVTRGYVYPEDLSAHFSKMKVDEATEAILGLRKVAAGRVDVIFEDPIWAKMMAKQENLSIKVLDFNVAVDPTYTVFGEKLKDIAKAYDEQIKAMAKSGAIDEAYKKYIGSPYKRTARILKGE